jgi:3'-5' exoribonuclease
MKKQYVNSLTPGLRVEDVFVLSEKTVSQKKNGGNYLNLTFGDRTGEVKGVAWDNLERMTAIAGNIVLVRGSVTEYRNILQLTVQEMIVCDKEAFDPLDFLPVGPRNPDSMFESLKRNVEEGVQDPYLKALLNAFWEDEIFVTRFKKAPGAKTMHHAYLGGLLEHTLSMTVLVKEIARHYRGINMGILLTGAVLHDIGKTREFEYEYRIDYTDEGRLLTHIVIGCSMLDEKIRQIPDFPADTAYLIKHMIVSHHGSREFGSPEPPRTLEAVLLNYIDEMDAKMNGLREFINNEDPGAVWTSYNRMLGRHLYKGKNNTETINEA